MVRVFALLALLVAGLSGCQGVSLGPRAGSSPAIDSDFPDPALLKAKDGFYYAYATQGGDERPIRNIQVARSRDLRDWELLPDALPVKPHWASATQDFWAPHVIEADGRYFLYYSAKPDAALRDPARGLCLAVATAARPEGPFTDKGEPLQCGPGFVNIDPMAFDDPASGKALLYWGSGFGPIKVQELAADRLSFAAESKPVDLIHPVVSDDPDEYQRLVEGAWMTLHGGFYYLFYSGDNCCGAKAHYAVMVARSRTATGPFQTLAAATGARDSVILEASGRWLAPGHNALITDARGDDWIAYHAIDLRRTRTLPSDGVNSRRVMLVGRISWDKGWPRVAGPRSGPAVVK